MEQAARAAQFLEHALGRRDRGMPKPGGYRDDEQAGGLGGVSRRGGTRSQRTGDDSENHE